MNAAFALGVASLLMVLGQGFGQLVHVLSAHAGETAGQRFSEVCGRTSLGAAAPHGEHGDKHDRGHDRGRDGHDPHGCELCVLLAAVVGTSGGFPACDVVIPQPELAALACDVVEGAAVERARTSAAPRGPPRNC